MITWDCRRDRRTFQNYLSRIPSIGTIAFTPETSVERWRIVATWKSCRRDQQKSGVWRGREKGDRRGIGLGEDCIPRVKLRRSRDDAWHRILAAFVEARGWEQLGTELFIELCFEDRPTRPFSFATCRFTSLFGQIRRYRSGATTFTRRKVSVNVVSFSDSRSRTSQNLSAFFVSVITLNYARHVLRKVAISGRDGNLRDFFLRNSEKTGSL